MDQLGNVKLRNGQEAPQALVMTGTFALNSLLEKGLPGLLAVYDLAQKLKNPAYQYSGKAVSLLQSVGLLDRNGNFQDCFKDVILSSIEGEGLATTFVSPIDKSEIEAEVKTEEFSALDFKQYFQTATAISAYILGINNKDGARQESRLQESPNPYYSAIVPDGSLLVESYYGTLSQFHTPLGQLNFGGGSSSGNSSHSETIKKMSEKLGLVEVVPVKYTDMGQFGPIYAITKDLDGNAIPLPKLPLARVRLDYDKTKETWKAVTPDYYQAVKVADAHLNPPVEIVRPSAPYSFTNDTKVTENLRGNGTKFNIQISRQNGSSWGLYGKITAEEADRLRTTFNIPSENIHVQARTGKITIDNARSDLKDFLQSKVEGQLSFGR